MNRKTLFLFACMAVALFMHPLGLSGQNHQYARKMPFDLKANRVARGEVLKNIEKVKNQQPRLVGPRVLEQRERLTQGIKGNVAERTLRNVPIATTPDGTELWGNVIFSNVWTEEDAPTGMYSLKAKDKLTLTPMAIKEFPGANGGGVYYDGKFHFVRSDQLFGYLYLDLLTFDTETWKATQAPIPLDNFGLYAVSATYDPTTGKAFGCYYSMDGKKTEIAEVDYDKLTHKTLAVTDTLYMGFAVNKAGELYAISQGGNLYKVDKTNGEVKLIGDTGVKPSQFVQSATFDMRTGKLYWASLEEDKSSNLYQVNTQTGKAEKIASFPNDEEVVCLYVPILSAEDGAPDVITDLRAEFEGCSKVGKVLFTAPSKTFSGNDLKGELTYRILANNQQLATGYIEAGCLASVEVTVPAGEVRFAVTTENSVGVSPQAKVQTWIGFDVPKAPDVAFSVDEDKKSMIAWNCPVGEHGGFLGDMKYEVTRYPDKVKVAEGLTTISVQDQLPESQLTAYYYGVRAITEETTGSEGFSSSISVGKPLEVPCLENFESDDAFRLFTVIDVNKDGKTWSRDSNYHVALSNYNKQQAADDWLITPAIHLEKENLYSFSYHMRAPLPGFTERVELKYGTGTTVEDMAHTVVAPTEFKIGNSGHFCKDIVVDKEGNYHFGFHVMSDANNNRIVVDSISIVKIGSLAAPEAVSHLNVVAADQGELKSVVTFKTPVKTLGGKDLDEILKIEILRNGQLIHTINHPVPGSEQKYVDTCVDKHGSNVYTVVAYNQEAGRPASLSAFIGEDVPLEPQAILVDKEDHITVKWTSSGKGKNGGFVNADKLKYTIVSIVDGKMGEVMAEDVSGTSYDIPFATEEGDQRLIQYGISAMGVGGASRFVATSGLPIGKSHELPFHESVSTGIPDMTGWWVQASNPDNVFGTDKKLSADNNAGSFSWKASLPDESATLYSGKISMAGGNENLSLAFTYFALPYMDIQLGIDVQKPDGTTEILKEIDFRQLDNAGGWTTDFVSLKNYVGERYLIVKFRYTSNYTDSPLYIDNINVQNLYDNNLSLSMTAPKDAISGTTVNVDLKVENLGKTVAKDFHLIMVADGKEVGDMTIDKPLNPTEGKTFPMAVPVKATDSGKKMLEAKLMYDDQVADDNMAVAEINVTPSQLPTPRNLMAENTGDGKVKLSWKAPENEIKNVEEDFESYTPWEKENIGDWTVVDGDKQHTFGLFYDILWPGLAEPQAYIVYNLANLGLEKSQVKELFWPRSGNQCLLSPDGLCVNDNWLISPSLSRAAQTISFWATSVHDLFLDSFEILYSTAGKDTADFKKIKEVIDAPLGWAEYRADLPEGATHFAIRLVSDSKLALFIDDISYQSGTAMPTGYNIYRDGELIANVKDDDLLFNDNVEELDGEHKYAITAVYPNGESLPVEVSVFTEIIHILADQNAPFNVYTTDGKLVGKNRKSFKGLHGGVYIINDKKVAVK